MKSDSLKSHLREFIEFCFHRDLWRRKQALFKLVMRDLKNPDLPWDMEHLRHPSNNYWIYLYTDAVCVRSNSIVGKKDVEIHFGKRLSRKIKKYVKLRREQEALFAMLALAEKANNDYIKNNL